MKLVKDGGYLATCSCSHFMTRAVLQTIREATGNVTNGSDRWSTGRRLPNHPILWAADESYYLKFYIFQVCEGEILHQRKIGAAEKEKASQRLCRKGEAFSFDRFWLGRPGNQKERSPPAGRRKKILEYSSQSQFISINYISILDFFPFPPFFPCFSLCFKKISENQKYCFFSKVCLSIIYNTY